MIARKQVDESVVMISPEKVLDNNNAHEMSEAIIQAQSEGYKYIILNLSTLDFISSAGVGSILGSIESSRGMGGDIILCHVPAKIRHIFEILDLCDFLTIVADREAAMSMCPVRG
jgi:stage II sporulation protein AA (anti-sigma F factor antagonist)